MPARLSDPTIPTKRDVQRRGNAAERGRVYGIHEGRLVDYGGGKVVLADGRGNTWDSTNVRVVMGSFGGQHDGTERAPRPWVYDQGSSTPIVVGDIFIIQFLQGDPEKPIIIGGVSQLLPADSEFFAGQAIGENPNRFAQRQAQIDSLGVVTGMFDIEAFANDTEQQVEIRVSGPTVAGGKCRILLDFKTNTISIGSGGETERALFGDKFLSDLSGVLKDIIAIGLGIPAGLAVPTDNAVQMDLDIAAALAAGPPYLGKVKVN